MAKTLSHGIAKSISLVAMLCAVSGCSYIQNASDKLFGEKKAPPAEEQTQPPVEETNSSAKISRPPTTQGIEVLWEIPKEDVDGFIVRYGFERLHMDHEIKLSKADVAEVNDAEFGKAYRYVIQPTPADKAVYVSIASFKGELVSEFSEVIEEKPKQGL